MKLPEGNSRGRAIKQRVCVIVVALGIGASLWALQSTQEAPGALHTAHPSVSAHLDNSPEQVRLSFDQAPASSSRAKVTVLSPEDENLAHGPTSTSVDGISQRVAGLREQGAYQVSYEVQLADGSVSKGQYWFWYAPDASGSPSWLNSTVLAGLVLVALASALLAIGRRRKTLVLVPSQRNPITDDVTASSVPAQRGPRNHEGLSPPGSRPRPDPEALPEPQKTDRPRQG